MASAVSRIRSVARAARPQLASRKVRYDSRVCVAAVLPSSTVLPCPPPTQWPIDGRARMSMPPPAAPAASRCFDRATNRDTAAKAEAAEREQRSVRGVRSLVKGDEHGVEGPVGRTTRRCLAAASAFGRPPHVGRRRRAQPGSPSARRGMARPVDARHVLPAIRGRQHRGGASAAAWATGLQSHLRFSGPGLNGATADDPIDFCGGGPHAYPHRRCRSSRASSMPPIGDGIRGVI
eukprot:366437-Chlamydomonas_euryale.AAC.7